MTIPPLPKTLPITTEVPEHLVEDFLATTSDFFCERPRRENS